jgi:hypothetical protein
VMLMRFHHHRALVNTESASVDDADRRLSYYIRGVKGFRLSLCVCVLCALGILPRRFHQPSRCKFCANNFKKKASAIRKTLAFVNSRRFSPACSGLSSRGLARLHSRSICLYLFPIPLPLSLPPFLPPTLRLEYRSSEDTAKVRVPARGNLWNCRGKKQPPPSPPPATLSLSFGRSEIRGVTRKFSVSPARGTRIHAVYANRRTRMANASANESRIRITVERFLLRASR